MMRNQRVIIIGLLALTLISGVSCMPSATDVLQNYVEAQNEHDVEGVISCYAEDIRFEIVGVFVLTGIDQLRDLAEWDSVLNVAMTVEDVTAEGDTVLFSLVESNDWFDAVGISQMRYSSCQVIVRENSILEIKAEPDPESVGAFNEVWPRITAWAARERPRVMALLLPDGEFVYNAANAQRWLKLLQSWRAAAEE